MTGEPIAYYGHIPIHSYPETGFKIGQLAHDSFTVDQYLLLTGSNCVYFFRNIRGDCDIFTLWNSGTMEPIARLSGEAYQELLKTVGLSRAEAGLRVKEIIDHARLSHVGSGS